MKIIISNNYGGEICTIKFEREKEEYFGVAVKINGYIETNSLKLQHVKSMGKFVQETLVFKIPRNVIPSFKNKNFKVEYEIEYETIYRDRKEKMIVPFEIWNNNVFDFDYKEPLVIDLSVIDQDEYNKKKDIVCKVLLENMKNMSDPRKYFESKLINDCKDDPEDSIEPISFIDKKQEFVSPVSSVTEIEISVDENDNEVERADSIINANNNEVERVDSIINDNNNEVDDDKTIGIEDEREINTDLTKSKSIKETLLDFNGRNNTNTDNDFTDEESKILLKKLPDEIINDVNILAENLVKNIPKSIENQLEQQYQEEMETKKAVETIKQGLGDVLTKMFEEKCRIDSEIESFFDKIQNEIVIPAFAEPNMYEISTPENTFTVVENNEKIGQVSIPGCILKTGYIKLMYLKNIRNTQIEIWREDIVNDELIDTELVFSLLIDSENCLEKIIDFEISGFTLKNFIFEVSYYIIAIFDGYECKIPIKVVSPNTLVIRSNSKDFLNMA